MKRAIIPTTILYTAICIGSHSQTNKVEELIATPEPIQAEVTTAPLPTPEAEIEIIEPEVDEPVIEVLTPEPTPEPKIQQPTTNQFVQAGNMVYVPGFGWFESQGEGTVIHDEIMRENGNKVGIMG